LIAAGVAVSLVGYVRPAFIGQGGRPYAYISVMAVGAMLVIVGVLLWRDA
jgi:hypothetical protein